MLVVKVVFHRPAFPDPKNPYRPRFVRLPERQQNGPHLIDPKDRLIPGQRARVAGLLRRVLGFGYEGDMAVVHVAR